MKSPDIICMPGAPDTAICRASRRPIRVGVVIFTTGYGGADTIVLNWIQALQHTPHIQTYLFAFAAPLRFLAKAAELDIPVHQLPWSRRKPLLRAAKVLAAYVHRFHIDILHCHNPYADFVGCLVKRYAAVQSVNTFHAWGESGIRLQILERLDLSVSRFFDQLTAASEAVRRGAIERGIPPERIKTVQVCTAAPPVCLSHEVQATERAKLGAAPSDVVFISLARFYTVKRYDVMLRAFRPVVQMYPHAQLWLVGDGPEEARMQALAIRLGLASQVKFFGYRADATALLPLADVQLLTSDIEGLPLAILEGMAAGLPIIATRVGGLPDVLVDGQSALFTCPGDVQEVTAAILDLLQHPLKRLALGRAAQRVFAERYAPDCGAASLAELYESLTTVRA